MINHARTLLLNRSGDKRPGITAAVNSQPESSSFFMEEYVPPLFHPVVLPAALAYAHGLLFGQGADDAYVNFRAAQYMRILHSTEFVDYVLALDPRVTYFANDDIVAMDNARTGSQCNHLDVPVATYINGVVEIQGSAPRLINEWFIEAIDTHNVRVMHSQTGQLLQTSVTFTNQYSSPIDLPTQSGLQVFLGGVAALTAGMTWKISTFNKPVDDLSDLLSTLVAQSQHLESLFIGSAPFDVFKKLWERELLLPYRLSGLLLAFIYSVEALRRG